MSSSKVSALLILLCYPICPAGEDVVKRMKTKTHTNSVNTDRKGRTEGRS